MLYYSINPQSFGNIGSLGGQIDNSISEHTPLKVKFLRPYCVAYLDQILLKDYNVKRNKKIFSTYNCANQYLKQCGFQHLSPHATFDEEFPQQNIIKVKRFNLLSENYDLDITNWVTDFILKFITTERNLENKIVKNIYELIYNGLYHGNCKNGVSVAGQLYPQMKYFELSICNNGNSIPELVKKFLRNNRIKRDSKFIEWAMEKGTTTKDIKDEIGGLGLFNFNQFININEGAYQFSSNYGYYGNLELQKPKHSPLKHRIEGTLVNIRIKYN